MVLHLAQCLRVAGSSVWSFWQVAQVGCSGSSEDSEDVETRSSAVGVVPMLIEGFWMVDSFLVESRLMSMTTQSLLGLTRDDYLHSLPEIDVFTQLMDCHRL